MTAYDFSEIMRLNSLWTAAAAKTFWRHPAFGLAPHPLPAFLAGWGEVAERSLEQLATKPDWDIDSVVSDDRDYAVSKKTVLDLPFCKLLHFATERERTTARRILLLAPMSGHYATLCRETVRSLLPNCDVFVTEWKNARDVPLSAGSFDIEDYTRYLVDFMHSTGEKTHVIAICQPVPLALAATAMLAQDKSAPQPRTLTLISGPVDPDANPTDVTDFGNRVIMDHLESGVIHSVGFSFAGAGRKVYPGAIQLASFISMNAETHTEAFLKQIAAAADGTARDDDRHNRFYDEYLAVMDIPAEFFLSTVERIFKGREIARNCFSIGGEHVDITAIRQTAVMVVEGGKDDISAPGQCLAALNLLPDLPETMKQSLLAPDAGHFGTFAGSAWRKDIRPAVLGFIDRHNGSAPLAASPRKETENGD
jgi:poly(3-hydroxybutyrate) depolymerase